MKNKPLKKSFALSLLFVLTFFLPRTSQACNTSGFVINNLINNGNGTFTLEMTVLVAGGGTTSVGSTWGFYWNIDVPIVSISPTSFTSSNGTTLNAVISGNNITWGDPNPSANTPFLDIDASPFDESFPVTIILDGPPTEWFGGGQEGNNCPNGNWLDNYMGEFPCQPGFEPTSQLLLHVCDGGSVSYGGMQLAGGSVTDFTWTAANGCDSIVTVTVEDVGPLSGTETLQACEGQPLFYNGIEITPGTSMDFTLIGPYGCDSVVTVTALEPVPPTFGSETLQGCENETLTYQGMEVVPGSVTEFTLVNSVGCDSIVTVTVLDPLPVAASSDTFEICLGATLDIAGQMITEAGVYPQNYVSANGCDSIFMAIVRWAPGPPLEMPDSVEIDLGEEWVLKPTVAQIGQIAYEWSPDPTLFCPDGGLNCPFPTVQPIESTTYFLTITDDEGCISQGSVEILVRDRRRVFIPNSFSPNGDGINDQFFIFSFEKSIAQINRFQVFSRWGELVFENYNMPPNDPSYGWDGSFLGEQMDNSVFVYTADIEFIDGEVLNYRGDVLLVR